MKLCLSAMLATVLLCIGCQVEAKDQMKAGNQGVGLTQTINHEGIKRTYHILLPSGFSKNNPAPLVFALHGGGGQGRKFQDQISLKTTADQYGVVLVFPEGLNRQWHDGRTEHLKTNKTYDDVGFISKIIDTMKKDYGIDSKRVYATGISNGGFMSIRLAMDLSEKITAIAPVTAQLPVRLKDKVPKRPISIMIVNGTQDPIVPFDGGHVRLFRFGRSRGEILSTDSTIERFRFHNSCSKTPKKRLLPDKDLADQTRVEFEQYTGCRDNTEVTLVKVIGGGHTWPGGKQYLLPRLVGRTSREIDASEMILKFFLKHSRKSVSVQ